MPERRNAGLGGELIFREVRIMQQVPGQRPLRAIPNFLSRAAAVKSVRRVSEQEAACAKVRGRGSGLARSDWRDRAPSARERHSDGRSGAAEAPLFPCFRRALVISLLWSLAGLLGGAPALAAGEMWEVDSAQGAVLVLENGEWREIGPGDRVRDGEAVRTLQTGSVTLRHGGYRVELGRETAVRLDVLGPSRASVVQYGGTVSAAVPDSAGLVVRAGETTTHAKPGKLTVQMHDGGASVSVEAGAAEVSDSSGQSVTITAEQAADRAAQETAAPSAAPAQSEGLAVPGGPESQATPSAAHAPADPSHGGGTNEVPGNGAGQGNSGGAGDHGADANPGGDGGNGAGANGGGNGKSQ